MIALSLNPIRQTIVSLGQKLSKRLAKDDAVDPEVHFDEILAEEPVADDDMDFPAEAVSEPVAVAISYEREDLDIFLAMRERYENPPELAAHPLAETHIIQTYSDLEMSDPVLAGLDERLLHVKKPLAPEGYGFIKTLGEKYGLPEEFIQEVQKRYAEHVPGMRGFYAFQDQFPGLKALVLFSPCLARGSQVAAGVTQDGKIFTTSFRLDPDECSVGKALQILRSGDDVNFRRPEKDFSLNPKSHQWRATVVDAAYKIMSDCTSRDFLVQHQKDPRFANMKKFLNVFTKLIEQRLQKEMFKARKALIQAMDPDILRAMHANHMTFLSDGEWLSGFRGLYGRFGHDLIGPSKGEIWAGHHIDTRFNHQHAEARLQAVKAYPFLAHHFRDEATDVIDERASLSEYIAEKAHVPESLVRKTVGLTWQKTGMLPKFGLNVFSAIRNVPIDFYPTKKSHFKEISRIESFSSIYGGRENAWKAFAKGGDPYRFAGDSTTVRDIYDMFEYIRDKLLFPAILQGSRLVAEETNKDVRPRLFYNASRLNEVFSKLGPKDLFAASAHWHRSLARLDTVFSDFTSDDKWDPMIGTLNVGEAISTREIVSAPDLKAQGRSEGHCVGGYASKVMNANSSRFTLIFSLENKGKTLSTIEISATQDKDFGTDKAKSKSGYIFSVVQNQGSGNSRPVSSAIEAGKILCKELQSSDPQIVSDYLDRMQVVARKSNSRRALPNYIAQAGYDVWDRGALEKAWEELSIYLPRSVRRAGLDDLMQNLAREFSLVTEGDSEGKIRTWEQDKISVDSYFDRAIVESPGLKEKVHDYEEMPF